jgi:N-acyl-D-aspartate/D-glutamate deacylase
MADLVIRGARICDGTGAPAEPGEIAVAGGRITTTGVVGERGTVEVDAAGLVCAPGFIDLHTHYDCQLFWDPEASPSPWHGVTTVVMGNCGLTLAPCRDEHRDTLLRLLAFVEGMPLDTLRAAIPWEWRTFGEFLAALERRGTAVNVGAFVGHSSIRLDVLGADAVERPATAEECRAMVGEVRDAMVAGALGWSTSRSPTHFFADDGKPAPSRLADDAELLALAGALAEFEHGVIEVAPQSTLAGADEKVAEQHTFAAWARASGKAVSWAPLFESPYHAGATERCLADAAAYQESGVMVVPQVGCRPLELRFDFLHPGFGLDNNPFWRPIFQEPLDARRRRFADPAFRQVLATAPRGFVAHLAPGWDRLVLRVAATAATRAHQDCSVAAVAKERGCEPVDAFCDLVLADDLAGQWGALVMNFEEDKVERLLRHPAAVVALSDAGAHLDTLCDQGFTTYLLGHWVRTRQRLGLEEAVRLVTSVPAARYGLRGRGRIAPGYAADLVLFDPDRVGMRPTEVVHDLPEGKPRLLQRAAGVEWVFVGGGAVVERGKPTGRRPGRVLRGGR